MSFRYSSGRSTKPTKPWTEPPSSSPNASVGLLLAASDPARRDRLHVRTVEVAELDTREPPRGLRGLQAGRRVLGGQCAHDRLGGALRRLGVGGVEGGGG